METGDETERQRQRNATGLKSVAPARGGHTMRSAKTKTKTSKGKRLVTQSEDVDGMGWDGMDGMGQDRRGINLLENMQNQSNAARRTMPTTANANPNPKSSGLVYV